jgi:hypothetical protein
MSSTIPGIIHVKVLVDFSFFGAAGAGVVGTGLEVTTGVSTAT